MVYTLPCIQARLPSHQDVMSAASVNECAPGSAVRVILRTRPAGDTAERTFQTAAYSQVCAGPLNTEAALVQAPAQAGDPQAVTPQRQLRKPQAVTVCRPDGRAYDFQFDGVLHRATQQATYTVTLTQKAHKSSGSDTDIKAQRLAWPARACRRARAVPLCRPCRGTAALSSATAKQASTLLCIIGVMI